MYADRYAPRRVNRGSLGLSIGIVAPLLAAAMLSSPTVRAHLPRPPFIIYEVPPPPPPPPPVPQPPVKAKPVPTTVPITAPVPVIKVPDTALNVPPPPPPVPVDLHPGLGAEAGPPVMVEPVKAPPVLVGAEVDGRYARDLQPGYPPLEQRAGRTGVVTLRVLIATDGRVRDAQEVSATSDAFWEATRKQALGRWRFRPATRDGVAYETWKTMTVRFRLEDTGE